jgi:DNA polymerase-3 subunit delta'
MSLPHLEGQPFAQRVLSAALGSGRTASAYLFEGPPGCGKKTAALDLASALVGGEDAWRRASQRLHPDVRLFSPAGASFKVEQVHSIIEEASLRPFEGDRKVFILDRVEDFTPAAANALLKPLEEPAASLTWILVTTQRANVLPTIASRCQSVRFHPLDEASLRAVLQRELAVDARRARDLAALSGGSVRQAAWYEGEDGKAQLQQAEAFLEAAASGSLIRRLDWVESVQDQRRGLDGLLGLLWILLRERWVEARGYPASLKLLQDPPRHGKALPPESLEALMQGVARCQAALARNGNAPLALHALALCGLRP